MTTATELTKRGIAACNAQDRESAEQLFRQAIELDPHYELPWLWLSSVLQDNAEKRYCLDQALAINPQSAVAQRGLTLLPNGITPRSPFLTEQLAFPNAASSQPTTNPPTLQFGVEPIADGTDDSARSHPNYRPTTTNLQGASKVTKTQAYLLIALLCVGVGLVSWNLFFKPAPQWEYRTVSFMTEGNNRTGDGAMKYSSVKVDDAQLASLGADGWELVGTYLEMETAYPNFGSAEYVTGLQPNIRPQEAVFIFKRQIKQKTILSSLTS